MSAKTAERTTTTLSGLLIGARAAKSIDLPEMSRATKIPERYLRMFEHEDASRIPADAYTRIFLKAYAKYLGLDASTVLSAYQSAAKAPSAEAAPGPRKHPKVAVAASALLTIPRLIRSLAIGGVVLGILGYFGFQVAAIFAPPHISLLSPAAGATVHAGRVAIEGTTAKEATVTINGQTVSVDANGNFSDTLELQEGKATVKITASKKYSRSQVLTQDIIVTP